MTYHELLETEEWKAISKLCIERDGCCLRCKSRKDLLAHHISYDIRDTRLGLLDLSLLETWCRTCHERFHGISNDIKVVDTETMQLELELIAYISKLGQFGYYKEYILSHQDAVPSKYDFHEEYLDSANRILNKLGIDDSLYPRYVDNAFSSDKASIDSKRRVIESKYKCTLTCSQEAKEALFRDTRDLVARLKAKHADSQEKNEQ